MKELFKKSKQNSLLGGKIRRMLKMKSFALVMLLFIGITSASAAQSTGDPVMQAVSIALASAPVFFVAPDNIGLSDSDKKGLESLGKFLSEQVDEVHKGLLSSEELREKTKEAFETFAKEYGIDKDKLKKIEEALKQQGIDLKALKEGGDKKEKTLLDEIKSCLTNDNIAAIKNRQTLSFELKAPATITTANGSQAPHIFSFEVLPGIHEAPVEQPVILTSLSKGKTSSKTIIWVNRINKEGGAAFIAEGALKPLMDWDYKEETSTLKKIAVATKVSTEMLHDFEYMESEIRNMLHRDLFQVVDAKLLSGVLANNEPKGILVGAGGYLGTGLDETIVMPNNADAIRAAMLQMRLLNFRPNIVFMNPTDAAVIDLTKSTTGNYIKIELEGVLRSLRVLETTEIAADKFLLMDTSKWTVKIYEDYSLQFGWENDDFRRNLVTVIAELRLHSYQNSVDAGSVIYDEFSTVKTALELA
jgi:HK97 family phage major capsid protein